MQPGARAHRRPSAASPSTRLDHLRQREGFALTDPGTDLVGALDEANYCIWCHEQGKDSCSKGLKEKAPADRHSRRPCSACRSPAARSKRRSPSSTWSRRAASRSPRSASSRSTTRWSRGTGHRICNDCMKSCIYQKQDPVNIPQAETRTLKDVLELPWGFEIYSLLTRWNPFDLRRPYPKALTGKRVLVVGLGPAGFTARAPPDERRPHRGRHRRPEDRAARRRRSRASTRSATASPFRPIKRHRRAARAARRARDGGLRRRGRVRHHGALGQELPQDHPPAARAAARSSRCSAACASAAR